MDLDRTAFKEHLALRSELALTEVCTLLTRELGLPPFRFDCENETEWGLVEVDGVEINVSRPYDEGKLQEWDGTVPSDCNSAVLLIVAKGHPTCPDHDRAMQHLIPQYAQRIADVLRTVVYHHNLWLEPGENVRQDGVYQPATGTRGRRSPMKGTYRYVGPDDIRAKASRQPPGVTVWGARDVLAWVKETGQAVGRDRPVAATFVIDPDGRLRIADRHSEHVACAGGGGVLSAGEVFFTLDGKSVRVAEVSNQSTGYCPEPESWPAVARALDRAGIEHPGGFTTACVFRRCEGCGSRNIVKDGWFHCGVCGAELPGHWNFD